MRLAALALILVLSGCASVAPQRVTPATPASVDDWFWSFEGWDDPPASSSSAESRALAENDWTEDDVPAAWVEDDWTEDDDFSDWKELGRKLRELMLCARCGRDPWTCPTTCPGQ